MSVKVVLGMGFGDEGKGITTEYLCSQDPKNTLVVRFSGGHQCGHKVINGEVEHIFSNFGAGSIVGSPTYWSKYCTFEPVGFIKEYRILDAKWVKPKIYLSPDCMVTTPYDIHACQHGGQEMMHGTTGTGFYRTKKRCASSHLQFTIRELLYCNTQDYNSWMTQIKKYYKSEPMDLEAFRAAKLMIKGLIDYGHVVIAEEPPQYEHVVCEGSQGLMLDPTIGYMPHCTPSDLTPRNVMAMGYKIDEVFLVSRVYQTRHGNGPMLGEEHPLPTLVNTEKETNVHNEYQGVFRRARLHLGQLLMAKHHGVDNIVEGGTRTNLVMTCTDQMSPYYAIMGTALLDFATLDEFVDFIGTSLGINGDIYTNSSPQSSTIRKW